MDPDSTINFVAKQHNNELHASPSSIVPHSLGPPSIGTSSNLATYVRDPTSHQPSKKSYQGANASSRVTAAFSTSSAPPTRIRSYKNKRNALASPAKDGAKISKDVVNSSGYAGGAAQIPTVDSIDSKFLPTLTINIPNSSGSSGDAA